MMKLQKIAAVLVSLLLCTAILAGCSETAGTTETEPKIISEAASETTTAAETALSEETEKSSEAEDETYTEPAELTTEAASETVSETERPAGQAGFTLAVDENYKSTTDFVRRELTTEFDRLVAGEPTKYGDGMIEGVKLNSWTVQNEKFFVDESRYEVTVTLDVAESELELLPAGAADYLVVYAPDTGGRMFLPMRRADEYDIDEDALIPTDEVPDYVNFCTHYTQYFSNSFSGDTVTDFSSPNPGHSVEDDVICAYAAARGGGGFKDVDSSCIPYSEYSETIEKILGFSADAINAKSCDWYNSEKDSIELPGRGGSWICGWLLEDAEGEEENTHVVTIDYYRDEFCLDKARTVRYTVRVNDDGTCTMLKAERLFTTDKDIFGGSV